MAAVPDGGLSNHRVFTETDVYNHPIIDGFSARKTAPDDYEINR